MNDEITDVHVALARFEGKLDAWSLQQARHEERLQAHSAKLDALQTQVTDITARNAVQQEAKRTAPSWPMVVSCVVAAISLVLLIAQQIYGG